MKEKIVTERRGFLKLLQMCHFVAAHAERFKPASAAAKTVSTVVKTVATLKTLTAKQGSLENRMRELARARADTRSALRSEVEYLYRTAEAIGTEKPGFEGRFQMPLVGDSKLLNAARSAIEDAAPVAAAFIRNAMPADFLESLKSSLESFERAREEHAKAAAERSVARKSVLDCFGASRAAAKRLDAVMRNTLRADGAALAAWKAACRVPRSRSKTAEATRSVE